MNIFVYSLNGKMNNLMKSGQSQEEAKESISGMISNTLERAKTESTSIGSILSQESKKLNQGSVGVDTQGIDSPKKVED